MPQDMSVYGRLKLVHGHPKESSCTYAGKFVDGLVRALATLICCCGCALADKGDVEQQGGIFVFSAGGECKLKHLNQFPEDDPDIPQLFKALGI